MSSPGILPVKIAPSGRMRCFGTKTGSVMCTVFEPVPCNPATFQLLWSTTTSFTGTRHHATVGGPSLFGIAAERMSQVALSTPLAQGQLPVILMPPSTTSTFGVGM